MPQPPAQRRQCAARVHVAVLTWPRAAVTPPGSGVAGDLRRLEWYHWAPWICILLPPSLAVGSRVSFLRTVFSYSIPASVSLPVYALPVCETRALWALHITSAAVPWASPALRSVSHQGLALVHQSPHRCNFGVNCNGPISHNKAK